MSHANITKVKVYEKLNRFSQNHLHRIWQNDEKIQNYKTFFAKPFLHIQKQLKILNGTPKYSNPGLVCIEWSYKIFKHHMHSLKHSTRFPSFSVISIAYFRTFKISRIISNTRWIQLNNHCTFLLFASRSNYMIYNIKMNWKISMSRINTIHFNEFL